MDGALRSYRRRLPNRRKVITETIVIGNMTLTATIGFDETGRPAEVFLSGAKDGSGMAAILDDASVVISVALQHGIPAKALAKSISRAPDGMGRISAASAIGAALDLLVEATPATRALKVSHLCAQSLLHKIETLDTTALYTRVALKALGEITSPLEHLITTVKPPA
jgi:ribonucleoside-diphosphate reductase alpha chain